MTGIISRKAITILAMAAAVFAALAVAQPGESRAAVSDRLETCA